MGLGGFWHRIEFDSQPQNPTFSRGVQRTHHKNPKEPRLAVLKIQRIIQKGLPTHAASHSVLQRFLRAASEAHKKPMWNWWNAICLDQAKIPLNNKITEHSSTKVRAASGPRGGMHKTLYHESRGSMLLEAFESLNLRFGFRAWEP